MTTDCESGELEARQALDSTASPARPAASTARDILTALWGADDRGNLSGVHFIAEKTPDGMPHHPVTTVAEALATADEISAKGNDAYFGCAEFKTTANRKANNAAGARGFWLDIDCGQDKAAENKGYLTRRDAIIALRKFCKSAGLSKPSIIVDSGHGLHTYWHFRDFVGRDQWCKLATKLKKLVAKRGLRTDPPRTSDIASVLRVPGTMNFKDPEHPKQVTILESTTATDLETFVAAVEGHEPELESNLLGSEWKGRDFPPSSAVEIIKHCPTLAYVAQVRGAVSEPLWRNMLGVVKSTTEGEPLCHEWSKGDLRYDEEQTQQKIDKWTSDPALCATFREMTDSKCEGCKQRCRSPIRLGWSGDLKPLEAALHEMSMSHFVAKVGGAVFVFDEEDESLLTDGMTFTAFQQFNAGLIVEGRNVAAAWLKSPVRRTYKSLVFDPSGKRPADSYNLWRGLAIEPKRGECRRIVAHIRDVWCGGDQKQCAYVLKWLALLVQRPSVKPEVALVLRSKEGAGKTIIIEMLLAYLGAHGFTAARKDQVSGRFNGHLFDKVLVVLAEAFFAGDPEAVASTKALVTDRTLGYEAKGKDSFSAPNHAHVISLTNNDWAVPAGADNRRWMVLDVSDDRIGDHAYFTALAEEIGNGGAEAFLYELLNINLKKFNPRRLPPSAALQAQQVETLMRKDPVAAWWLHALSGGCIPGHDGYPVDWDAEIETVVLQDSYTDFTARFRGAPAWDVAAKRLRTLLPSGGLQKIRKGPQTSRHFVYKLPDLNQARQDFTTVTGIDPCAV